jgi:hypothetical protein
VNRKYICWWGSNRGNLKFCASGPALCTQYVSNLLIDKSLLLLSQEIGVDDSLFSSLYHLLCLQNVTNTGFTVASLARPLTSRLFADCVKTCKTVSTLSLTVELRGLQSVPCPHFALFHQLQTYRATVQLLHFLVTVFHIHFSNIFAPPSHFPFPVAFKYPLISLKC